MEIAFGAGKKIKIGVKIKPLTNICLWLIRFGVAGIQCNGEQDSLEEINNNLVAVTALMLSEVRVNLSKLHVCLELDFLAVLFIYI